MAVPVQEAAWPIYRPKFAKFGFVEGGERFDEIYIKEENHRLVTPADGPAWQAAIDELAGTNLEIPDARQGIYRIRLGPLGPDLDRPALSGETTPFFLICDLLNENW